MKLNVETRIKLDKFTARSYQIPICTALENKGYKKLLVVLPRRAGKDVCAFNLTLRAALRKVGVYFYIFPTYAQGRKVIWDSITNSGAKFLDFIPKELLSATNSQEMKITLTNSSIIQLVGSDNYDCYDEKTEVLTEDGWKLFKDLNQTERVATLKEGSLVYDLPSAYQQYDYNGLMYGISNKFMDFLVTPRHRFLVYSSKGVATFKEISDETIKNGKIPSTCDWSGEEREVFKFPEVEYSDSSHHEVINKELPMDKFVALLGIALSKGSIYSDQETNRVTIFQEKEAVRKKIKVLLKECDINFSIESKCFIFEHKQMHSYFSSFGKQDKRYIPKEIKSLSKKYLQILFDWMLLGDGFIKRNVTTYYHSTSKSLVDDMQEVAIKLGMCANIHIKPHGLNPPLYELRFREFKFKRLYGRKKDTYIFKSEYAGKVYCLTVPSGVVKVRRNGKELWSGNSLVGTNPQGCVFSEYALQDPRAYQLIRPILTANGGWALFISTPR